MADEEAEVAVPTCGDCGNLLGLYFSDCRNCLAHAGDYSLFDYINASSAGRSEDV